MSVDFAAQLPRDCERFVDERACLGILAEADVDLPHVRRGHALAQSSTELTMERPGLAVVVKRGEIFVSRSTCVTE